MPRSDLLKGRCSMTHQAYHITCTTYRRARWFESPALARIVIREMRALHEANSVDSLAWALMPDHFHWLFTLQSERDLAGVMQSLKGRSAKLINDHLHRSGTVWQKGFYDHAVRANENLQQIARYIVANPLRAGLVQNIGDYPWWDAVWLENSLHVG
ncbi:REP-associated tyrosine transposase [Chitinibacter sp. S2-10]|uniref:REP-associated tyrosine transposase n=1 Tax=Chitinibacter sp. S2-10 TaxID=3373597 RepID=UPI003977AE94